MVIFAYLDTNIRDVVQDYVDKIHRIEYNGSLVAVQPYSIGGGDILNTLTGELRLGNIQYPERPIVHAMASYHSFDGSKFNPQIIPKKDELHLFPTMFELERLAKEPLVINGIVRLTCDNVNNFKRDEPYFIEQKTLLDTFLEAYRGVVKNSPVQKPVLEGFYNVMKQNNVTYLLMAEHPERNELMKAAYRRMVYQQQDFISTFGANLYQQLREKMGAPRFE